MKAALVMLGAAVSLLWLSGCCNPYEEYLHFGTPIADTSLGQGQSALYDLNPVVWYTTYNYGYPPEQGFPTITLSTSDPAVVRASLQSDSLLYVEALKPGTAQVVIQAHVYSGCGDLIMDATHFSVTVRPDEALTSLVSQ